MTTKRVDAGIRSKKEAAERLIAGEVFYDAYNKKIYFDGDEVIPFRYGDEPLSGVWATYIDWETEVEIPWYEEADAFPRLCRVWDTDVNAAKVHLIDAFEVGKIYSFRMGEVGWTTAEPLTLEEVKRYVR